MKRNALIVGLVVVVVAAIAYLKGPRRSTNDEPAARALPRLVELGAGKCEACKKMAPIIHELKKEHAGRLIVESIDVLQEAERARTYNWRLIPCQVFFNASGRELWRHEGFIAKKDILAKWKELGVDLTPSAASTSGPPPPASAPSEVGEPMSSPGGDDELRAHASAGQQPDAGQTADGAVIAYYFHRTRRCPSCLTIEEFARQAIQESFSVDLASGRLEFRPVNIEQVGNERFENDYRLTAQSLVLVRMKDGKPADWKNLTAVWELWGDYVAFTEYVRDEVTQFMGGTTSGTQ